MKQTASSIDSIRCRFSSQEESLSLFEAEEDDMKRFGMAWVMALSLVLVACGDDDDSQETTTTTTTKTEEKEEKEEKDTTEEACKKKKNGRMIDGKCYFDSDD